MPELVKHPYECTAKGHAGGNRTFYAAPPDWFAAKGISTPKNCPDCRAWVKQQTDEMKACSCGSKIRITARSKISHFKKVGPYESVEECRSCREGNKPQKGTKKFPDKKKRLKKQEENKKEGFDSLLHGVLPKPRPLIVDSAYYQQPIPGKSETRLEHIGKHVPGSPNDRTSLRSASAHGQSMPSSPTSLVVSGNTESLIAKVGSLLNDNDMSKVREYAVNRRIYRVSYSSDDSRLELTIVQKKDDGMYELITTYDSITPEYVKGQDWYIMRGEL